MYMYALFKSCVSDCCNKISGSDAGLRVETLAITVQ